MEILEGTQKKLSEAQERINYRFKQVNDMLAYDDKNRKRNYENQKIYWGIDYGQWPEAVVQEHIRWKRQIATLNVARQKVNGLAGALLTNRYNIDYIPIEGKDNGFSNILKDLMAADRELLDWKLSEKQCVIDSLIYEGIEEMFVSNEYNKLGNVGFRALQSGLVVMDPQWKTYRVHDLRRYAKIGYLSARQILNMYSKKTPQIMEALKTDERAGDIFGTNIGLANYQNLSERDGSQFKVIEYYELRDEEEEYEIDLATNTKLPKTDDVQLKMEWLNRMVPDRDPGQLASDVIVKSEKKRVLYVEAFCPELQMDDFLANGKHEIQIGRAHIFPLSAGRMNGEKSGIIDLIKDPQRIINYRNSLITYAMQTGVSGGMQVDDGIFNGDFGKAKEFDDRKSDPSYVCHVAPGMSNKYPNGIKPIPKGDMPYNEAQAQLNGMLDMIDRISFQPAAADARTQSSGESGVLFAQKVKMAEIGQFILMEGVKQHVNDKGEAYFFQAKNQYSLGDAKREFTVFSEKKNVTINEKINVAGGGEMTVNRMADVPRHKVIVTESPQGETRRLTAMMAAADLLGKLPPENVITRQILTNKLVMNADMFDDEDKAKLKEAGEMELELAKAQVTAQIQQISQAQQMQEQAMAQQAPQGGQGMPAMPQAPQGGMQ